MGSIAARALALIALGGCDSIWGLTEVATPPEPDAATAISERCIPGSPSESFDAEPICIGVGLPLGTADTLEGGDLVVTLPGPKGSLGGCLGKTIAPFTEGGLFANIPQIAMGNDFNVLNLHWDDHKNTTAMFATPAGLDLRHAVAPDTVGTSLGTGPLAPWWRIRPSEDRSAILGESSMDGTHWVPVAMDPVPAPQSAFLEVSIGSFATEPAGLMPVARVASINVCPRD